MAYSEREREFTFAKNLVNVGPVRPEFKRVKCVHPIVDQHFGYVAPLLDLARISRSTEFSGAITTQFCFSYLLEDGMLCRAGYTLVSATHF